MADAAHVVVAQEGRQLSRRALAALIDSVTGEHGRQPVGACTAGDDIGHRRLEGEVQHRRQLIDLHVPCQDSDIGVENLAEDVEVLDALGLGPRQHRRDESLPELGVHMAGGVDAVAVNAELVDPAAIDLDEALDDTRVLGEQVVQP